MFSLSGFASERPVFFVMLSLLSIFSLWAIQNAFSKVCFHKLSKFPGPKVAAVSVYYKAWIEGVLAISWHKHLVGLHAQYGPIVRVGPNELHFSDPQAYNDIYNNSNRWDKEETLYHSFGQDRSSFGFLTYKESKARKDVLNKSFSTRAISEAQSIIQSKVDELCSALTNLSETKKPINLSHAYRCMTTDIITTYCFGTSINAIHTPNFRAPIVVAIDAAVASFIWFKHSPLYKTMILNCPRSIARATFPPTAGLIDLQEILETQIADVTNKPETLDALPHRQTIYHSLLDPSNYKSRSEIPSAGSIYEEAQGLMFAGSDTVGNTLMVMTYHLLQPINVTHLNNLQSELEQTYPNPSLPPPPLSTLETLPYLSACLKEGLRLSSGVISGLSRIVPPGGATISQTSIPGGTIVSIGSTFVHYNATIFPNPETFNPSRWLTSSPKSPLTTELDAHLVPFSRGPRACLGINLAWAELRLTTASVFRRFEMELCEDVPSQLEFRDTFLPSFTSAPVLVRVKAVRE